MLLALTASQALRLSAAPQTVIAGLLALPILREYDKTAPRMNIRVRPLGPLHLIFFLLLDTLTILYYILHDQVGCKSFQHAPLQTLIFIQKTQSFSSIHEHQNLNRSASCPTNHLSKP